MSVSFGQEATWMEFSDETSSATKAVNMAQVLYIEFVASGVTRAGGQQYAKPASATLILPGNVKVPIKGDDVERARKWVAARVAAEE